MIYDGRNGELDNLESTVRRTTKALREHLDEFDSIAVTGTSGLLVGAPAALRVRKPLVVVRKEDDGSHDWRMIINEQNMGDRVLFLDDFVATGDTRSRVIEAVEKKGAKVVAEFLYHAEPTPYDVSSVGWSMSDTW